MPRFVFLKANDISSQSINKNMNKALVLIVEDENIIARDIQNCLRKLGYSVAGICSTGEKAIDSVRELKPDLVLMDIKLKGELSGIDTAQHIKKMHDLPVIFLTAFADEETLEKAKITEPYGYIIKPFKEVELMTNIELALYKHGKIAEIKKERDFLFSLVEEKGSKDLLFVKSNSRLVKLHTKDIFFVEALKDYVILYTPGARYTIHSTMKDIQNKLPSADYVRAHRSYIVRMDRIAAIEQSHIVLDKDQFPADRPPKLIPIGGSYKEELLNRVNLV